MDREDGDEVASGGLKERVLDVGTLLRVSS